MADPSELCLIPTSHAEAPSGVPDGRNATRLLETPMLPRPLLADHIDQFNRDVRALPHATRDAALERARETFGPVNARIAGVYAVADELAIRLKARCQRHVRRVHALYGGAVLTFGLANLLPRAIIVYVAVVAALAWIVQRTRRSRVEDRFLDYRALAEALRVLAFWRSAGIDEPVSAHYLTKHLGVTGWIRGALWQIESAAEPEPNVMTPDRVIRVRVGWVQAQQRYLEKNAHQLTEQARRWQALSVASFALTLIVAVAFAVLLLLDPARGNSASGWFQATLGLVGGTGVAAQAYQSKQGFNELQAYCRLIHEVFQAAEQQLDQPGSDPRRVLIQLGREALMENSQWLAYHRRHPLEPLA